MSHDISWHFHFCVRMDYGEICLSVIFDTTEKVRGWLQGRIGLHSHPEYVSSRQFTQTRFNPLSVFTTARAYWHRKFVTRFDPHTWKQTKPCWPWAWPWVFFLPVLSTCSLDFARNFSILSHKILENSKWLLTNHEEGGWFNENESALVNDGNLEGSPQMNSENIYPVMEHSIRLESRT